MLQIFCIYQPVGILSQEHADTAEASHNGNAFTVLVSSSRNMFVEVLHQ